MKYSFLKDIARKRFSINSLEEKSSSVWSSLSFGEKALSIILIFIFIVSGLGLLLKVSNAFLVEIPEYGGHYTEGIIGTPRFINPLLSISEADKDLTSLVYSGLLKATPEGELITDLAKEWNISEDGLVYTFILKDDIYFHDGEPVTTEDVEFTIKKALDPLLKSPRRNNWEGTTTQKINEKEIRLILGQPHAPFLENTTLGILPKHIWENANSDEFAFSKYNLSPVGTGPFKITDVKRNSAGLPILFELTSFSEYTMGRPFIDKLNIKIYQNEQELIDNWKAQIIDGISGISAEKAASLNMDNFNLYNASLPRIFGVFFNQNQGTIFLHKEVREALNIALNKENIIKNILSGYGTAIESPLPIFAGGEGIKNPYNIEKAKDLLEKNGWLINEQGIREKKGEKLTFSISTSNAPELKKTAELISSSWKDIGVEVEIKVFESGDLNQNVIRPRKYDSLLFGIVVGRDIDLYPFWHSSQRNDPGLNIALYTNIATDKVLEQLRTTTDKTKRLELYKFFESAIEKDKPAVFIYSPDFLYILPQQIKKVRLGHIMNSGERFLNIHEWFIETNKVWEFFTKESIKISE